jgi:hypothetical protein
MKMQMLICIFIPILVGNGYLYQIQVKFVIDINDDELLNTIWEHKKRKLIAIGSAQAAEKPKSYRIN